MLNIFFGKPHAIQKWANAKGYSGTPYDAIFAYFRSNSSLTDGTLYDYIINAVQSSGFDSLEGFFETKTGIQGRVDAEKAFWNDSTLDFFTGITHGVLDDSGNLVLDDSGNVVKG